MKIKATSLSRTDDLRDLCGSITIRTDDRTEAEFLAGLYSLCAGIGPIKDIPRKRLKSFAAYINKMFRQEKASGKAKRGSRKAN